MAYPLLIALGFLAMLALTQRVIKQNDDVVPQRAVASAC
jgi:hypothetical protein